MMLRMRFGKLHAGLVVLLGGRVRVLRSRALERASLLVTVEERYLFSPGQSAEQLAMSLRLSLDSLHKHRFYVRATAKVIQLSLMP